MKNQPEFLKHFSHEHPLEYVTSRRFDGNRVCSACKLTIMPKNSFYQCKVCQFSLHKVCYSMPKKVMHPTDPNHYLNLSTSSVTGQSNECDACGRYINGFYYSCTKCCLYYHMLCVAMPLSVKIPSSHPHIIKLELKPPYDFRCDLCGRTSYNGWLYRCRLCEFDAHVSCAVRGITQSPYQRSVSQISSLEDDRMRNYQHELMELLAEGMKGVKVKNVKNLDQNQCKPLDQSIPVSEDFTLPSYQFSDACFSIDISKSIRIEENRDEDSKEAFDHRVQLPGSKEAQNYGIVTDSNHSKEKAELVKRQSFDFGKKALKRELSLAPSTGIGSHVWEELGHEDNKKNVNATNNKVNLKRPFWLKLLTCF